MFIRRIIMLPLYSLYGFFNIFNIGRSKIFHWLAHGFSIRYDVSEISPVTFLQRIDSKQPTLIYDVRAFEEQNISIIPGAICVDEKTELFDRKELKQFIEQYPHEGKIIVYCAGGLRASKSARKLINRLPLQLRALVSNLYGGIFGYANAGGPLISMNNNTFTNKVHGCTKTWAKFLDLPNEVMFEK